LRRDVFGIKKLSIRGPVTIPVAWRQGHALFVEIPEKLFVYQHCPGRHSGNLCISSEVRHWTYCTVHGPLSRIGCESEWRVMIALWLDAALILLLLHSDSRPFRSCTLPTLICTTSSSCFTIPFLFATVLVF
jgi:hypothetical protein